MMPRRNSYIAKRKFKAIEYALANKTAVPAKHFEITERMIHQWKNERHVLNATKRTNRANRFFEFGGIIKMISLNCS